MDESENQISHKIQIWSEFPDLPPRIVDSDSPIRKRKSLNLGYFDGPFLSMIFHFLAANSEVRTACPLSFIFMFVTAFLERHLSIVGGGYGENPTSKSNSLYLKVTTVRLLPAFGLRKEFLSELPFCHFRERRADGHFMEFFSEAQCFGPNHSNE
jgi:hypothetical protein